MAKKEKKLILMNGRGFKCNGDHLYIGAYSVADASRLMTEAYAKLLWTREMDADEKKFYTGRFSRDVKEYFSKGSWGTSMEGVNPERGVWYAEKGYLVKPVRLI